MSQPEPRERVARGMERYRGLIDDWEAFLEAASRPLPACVWTHEGRIGPQQLRGRMSDDGLSPRPIAWLPGAFRLGRVDGLGLRWWYQAGLCHGQEEASMVPVSLLDPRPGQRVLDLCSAPGGKTAQLSMAVGPAGTVVANEVSVSRLRALHGTLDRLGSVNVTLTNLDGCHYPLEAGGFDRVLVDAPCSDEGTLRKNPRLLERLGSRPRGMSGRQTALLRRAVRLCRPGGRIAYSTCTFAPEENEAVVDAVLRRGGVRLVEVAAPGLNRSPGITSWGERRFHPSLRRAVRLWPHQNDSGGFFVAVLEREEGRRVEPACLELPPAPAREWLPHAGERYEMPDAVWAELRVHRRTTRGLHVVNAGHRLPRAVEPHAIGRLLVKDRIRRPKLTTVGALLLGRHARRNAVEVDRAGLDRYLARASFPLGEAAGCDEEGYVIVRHLGFAVGTGYLDRRAGEVRSLFPRRWAST